jgi:hypothetical protein
VSSPLTRELELLKSELTSLVSKYESLANKYDHDIKSFACKAKIEEETNDELEAQLVKLTSEHMALQADHKGLECSYEKLVDSYAILEIAHEVVLSSVKSIQPLSHTCTCSQAQINLSCTNDCLSQASQSSIEHVLVESCDDLIAKENYKLKQEVEKLQKDLYVLKEKSKMQPSQDNREDMVKKLEKGSTVTSSTPQQHTMTHKNKIKKRARLGKPSPNIAQSSTRHKSHSPRSLEAPTSGGCATSAERRDTLPTHAQMQQWAVVLTVTGQTGAGQGSPTSSKQGKEDTFSKNKAKKQAWKRNCKE